MWKLAKTRRDGRSLLANVRDVNILSGAASNSQTVACLGALILRRRIMAFGQEEIAAVSLAHAGRLLATTLLLIVQWSLALPRVVMTTGLLLVTIFFVINRMPFAPNRDLLALGVCQSVKQLSGDLAAPLAAVLQTSTVLMLAANAGACVRPERRKRPPPART